MTHPLAPLLPVRGERHALELVSEDGDWIECAIIRFESGEAVGSLALEAAGDELRVGHLWVAPTFRSYGAGSETARLLRQLAADAGFTTLRAWAHPNLGLSVYFWIRMGLHPLHGEGRDGGIWYVGEVESCEPGS